ncbi:hypothetical protein EK904_009187 [Melospiza melodia maxima]|nr:hypothetical protein EK904_009187 [Melospiza melodia maxima]
MYFAEAAFHLPQPAPAVTSFFKAESAIQHKTLLFLTLSKSRTEECSSLYAQILLISMVGSSMDRDQPGLYPSLGFELSSCLAELPVLWGTPGISLEPKFSSVMPSSSFLGEPQLQGCSLLPRADRAEAFYRAILVPNPCRHRLSLVCRLKCQPRALSDHS